MRTLSDADKLAVAQRFNEASVRNDAAAFAALCATDAVVWHNHDRIEVPCEQTARSIGWLHRNVSDLNWAVHSVVATSEGFVMEMEMTGTAAGGPLGVLSCAVVTLNSDGLITRIAEYLDSAQTKALRG
jgi:uncharacterized protein